MNFKSRYYLVDIDGTLTNYCPGPDQRLVNQNFLFPIFCDMMVENGWNREEAEQEITRYSNEVIFWDYPDFIAQYSLSVPEAYRRIREWHRENIVPYRDTVEMIRQLAADGCNLFIMSNNPYTGCIFKLQAAGLAEDDFSSPYFRRILGTNILRGCKSNPDVWKRAFAQIPVPVSEIGVIGDNPVEDGEIPRSLGVQDTVIIPRETIVRGIDR